MQKCLCIILSFLLMWHPILCLGVHAEEGIVGLGLKCVSFAKKAGDYLYGKNYYGAPSNRQRALSNQERQTSYQAKTIFDNAQKGVYKNLNQGREVIKKIYNPDNYQEALSIRLPHKSKIFMKSHRNKNF